MPSARLLSKMNNIRQAKIKVYRSPFRFKHMTFLHNHLSHEQGNSLPLAFMATLVGFFALNRLFSYSAKESGSRVIFIHFYTRGSIEWR